MWLLIVTFIIIFIVCLSFFNISLIFTVGKDIFVVAKFLIICIKAQIIFENPGFFLYIRFGGREKKIKIKISPQKNKQPKNEKKKTTKSSVNVIPLVASCIKMKSLDIRLEAADAAATAMYTGYIRIILNTLTAFFYENFKDAKISVSPEFSGKEKFEFSCILSVKPAHIIIEYIKKRGTKHASYRKFVANDYEGT